MVEDAANQEAASFFVGTFLWNDQNVFCQKQQKGGKGMNGGNERRKRIGIGFFCVIGCLLWGCRADKQHTETEKTPLRAVYFSREKNLYQENNVWAQIAEGLEEEAQNYENLIVSVYEQADGERIQYDEQVEIAIAMETDVLIAHGALSQTVKEKYQELKEAGISLVLLDGDVPESGRILYIGTDNRAEGRKAALLALEKMEGDIAVGILDEQRDVNHNPVASLSDRQAGFEEAAREHERIKIKAAETGLSSLLKVAEATERMLKEHPEINLLFCTDSITGQAAAGVVKEQNLTGKVHIICFDMTEEIGKKIEEGVIDFTMVQQMKESGKICVRELAGWEEGENPREIYLECVVVTKENIEEHLR